MVNIQPTYKHYMSASSIEIVEDWLNQSKLKDYNSKGPPIAMELVDLLSENIVQGLVIGYVLSLVFHMASKKLRIILLVQFVLLKWLEARNIIIIDWNRMTFGLLGNEDFVIGQALSLVESLIAMGIYSAALFVGFLVGRKIFK
jgi:uncharacterized membrane protein (Fun14 family)